MAGKFLGPGEGKPSGENISFIESLHEEYVLPSNARIRREYMDMANGDFYGTVFREAKIPSWARVLDLGCGDGTDMIKLQKMAHFGLKIGLETSTKDIGATGDKLTYIIDNLVRNDVDNAWVMLGDAQELSLDDNSVDYVIAASVLQEVFDIDRALDEIYRVLSPRGKLIIIENRQANKPLHHGYLEMMAQILEGVAPPPFSARFTHEIADRTMEERDDFKVLQSITQNKKNKVNLPIRDEEQIRQLLLSLDTYRYGFKPKLEADWTDSQIKAERSAFEQRLRQKWPDARMQVKLDVIKRIRRQKAAQEKIKRGALICEVNKRPSKGSRRPDRSIFESLGKLSRAA